MVALSFSNPVWEIESTLKQLLHILPMQDETAPCTVESVFQPHLTRRAGENT